MSSAAAEADPGLGKGPKGIPPRQDTMTEVKRVNSRIERDVESKAEVDAGPAEDAAADVASEHNALGPVDGEWPKTSAGEDRYTTEAITKQYRTTFCSDHVQR